MIHPRCKLFDLRTGLVIPDDRAETPAHVRVAAFRSHHRFDVVELCRWSNFDLYGLLLLVEAG